MRLLKVMTISLLLVGCDEQTRKDMFPTPAEEAAQVHYYKDPRTNLCFVRSYVNEYPMGTATIFTNVPCTPEVEKLISK